MVAQIDVRKTGSTVYTPSVDWYSDAEQLNLRLKAVLQATDADPEMQALQDTIQRGFPTSKADLPSMLHPFRNARDALNSKMVSFYMVAGW